MEETRKGGEDPAQEVVVMQASPRTPGDQGLSQRGPPAADERRGIDEDLEEAARDAAAYLTGHVSRNGSLGGSPALNQGDEEGTGPKAAGLESQLSIPASNQNKHVHVVIHDSADREEPHPGEVTNIDEQRDNPQPNAVVDDVREVEDGQRQEINPLADNPPKPST